MNSSLAESVAVRNAPSRVREAPWPLVAVWALTIAYAAILSILSIQRYDRFANAFDLAIFTQYTWLLGHGLNPVNTISGRSLLAEHIEPGLALFAPIGALGLGPTGLLAAQASLVALVAPVLYAIGRVVGGGAWLPIIAPVLWFVSPATYGPAFFEFHPETAAPVLLALAALGLLTGRTWLFIVAAILAVSLKEDVALATAMLGVVAFVRGRRRLGVITTVTSLAWFALSIAVLLPALGRSIQDDYAPRFGGERGDTLAELVRWTIGHPSAMVIHVFSSGNVSILALFLVATAGLCLLAPLWLLPASPVVAVNFVSAYPPQHSLGFQYFIVTWGATAVAAAVGVGVVARAGPRVRLAVVLAAGVVIGISASLGVHRLAQLSGVGTYPAAVDRHAVEGALRYAQGGLPVAASGRIAVRLAERREMYALPFPFLGARPGTVWDGAELARRARCVRTVIYDRTETQLPELAAPYAAIPHELRGRGFVVIYSRGPIAVYRRPG